MMLKADRAQARQQQRQQQHSPTAAPTAAIRTRALVVRAAAEAPAAPASAATVQAAQAAQAAKAAGTQIVAGTIALRKAAAAQAYKQQPVLVAGAHGGAEQALLYSCFAST